jgi:hypothetical protein
MTARSEAGFEIIGSPLGESDRLTLLVPQYNLTKHRHDRSSWDQDLARATIVVAVT